MLKIIDKYPNDLKNSIINVRYELSSFEKRLFIRFFIGKEELNGHDHAHLNKISGRIYEQEKWIQCDCVEGYEKPLMRLKRSQAGNLFLARIIRKNHHVNCPFKEMPREDLSYNTNDNKPIYKIKDGPFNLIPKKVSGISVSAQKNRASQSNSSSKRRHTLCNCLYTLLEKAKLNWISLAEEASPFQRLLQTASILQIVANLPLSDYFYTSPTKKTFYEAAIALKQDKRQWPTSYAKHCVFLVKAKSYDRNQIEAFIGHTEKTVFIEIANQIILSSGRLSERSGPFMAFIVVKDSVLKPGFYEPTDAFIVPCYSQTTFIPVDSYYERIVLKSLFALQFAMKKQGIVFEIIKPLFDISVEDEAGIYNVLPDFLIKTPSKTIVIEVAGSHEQEYLDRKQRTHQYMQRLGPLLTIDCYGAEQNHRLDASINQLLTELKSHL